MYGLILENMGEYIKQTYGEDKWEEIRRAAAVDQPSFSTHQVYPEGLIPRLSKKAIQILKVSEHDFFDQMGVFFIGFVSQYGYDRVLSVLGRHMRDFLNGLDNLHEYLKFSYPRMRAPSFICENETRQGLTLHYRSKRRGFVYYTMGQIREVAKHFYHKEMKIELVREELLFDMVHVTFQLTFDNRAFTLASLAMTREEKHLPISASVLFEIFPFCIVFGSDMIVRSIGNSLMVILPDLVGKKITNWFDLVRPLIAFKFQTILNRTNNIFELVTVEPVLNDRPSDTERQDIIMSDEMDASEDRNLRLKGQMIYMDNWKMMMYLGTPVMPDLNSLINSGLYINDLSMHDFSRDLMLAGTQQSVELKLALDQEQQKSKKLEESMRKLDEEMRRTDELLYQMIPKQVADRLRKGENPIDTCEMFDSVSILFSDVVTFTEICSRITPMEVVSMLNGMYSIFDTLTERNRVYKVETIGDAYMVVSGAPEKEGNHSERVCDMALDMVDAITDLKDPSTGQHLRIRVGVHSGAVVAGIVGLKMPRYCLFGDSVNTASRMESTSEAMKVHISQSTRERLPQGYKVLERGEIQIKGKGTMKTYWLCGKEARTPLPRMLDTSTLSIQENDPLDSRDMTPTPVVQPTEDRRAGVYSPITFQDVARRSIASSPVKTPGGPRELRSNSAGAVYNMFNPADLFGSSVLDSGICSSDQSSRSSARSARSLARSTTIPPKFTSCLFAQEVSLTPQGYSLPLHPPRHRSNTIASGSICHKHHMTKIIQDNHISEEKEEKDRPNEDTVEYHISKPEPETISITCLRGKPEVRIDKSRTEDLVENLNLTPGKSTSKSKFHDDAQSKETASETVAEHSKAIAKPQSIEQSKYEFGKSMHEYVKKFEKGLENTAKKANNQNHQEMSVSKSDGDICDRNDKSPGYNMVSHSHSQEFNKAQQVQQCCSGFGTTNKHRFQSNACVIV